MVVGWIIWRSQVGVKLTVNINPSFDWIPFNYSNAVAKLSLSAFPPQLNGEVIKVKHSYIIIRSSFLRDFG